MYKVSYRKLFRYLESIGRGRTCLLDVISPPTLAKLGKGESVTTDTVMVVCVYLGLQPSDIMEVVKISDLYGGAVRE